MARPFRGAWLCAVVAFAAAADVAPTTFALREGTLRYTVVHKLHHVTGTCHALEGRAQVQPDGALRVQVRARLAAFDSGNSNRDEHMREATHEPEHPWAEVKGTATGVRLPLSAPVEVPLDATVQLNGVKAPQSMKVKLEPAPDGVRARVSFPISLTAFHVERPELLLVAVDDRVQIEGELLFGAAP